MSDLKVTAGNGTVLKQKPVIKLSKVHRAKPGESELLSSLGLITDILIYESSNPQDAILAGQFKQLKLRNYYNRVTNSSRTFANSVELNGAKVVKNSDLVTRAIGQKSYDLVFHALCSVLSNDTKIKAMLALLTVPSEYKDCSTQTDNNFSVRRCDTVDAASQTDIMTPLNVFKKKKPFRNKRKLVPYVVQRDDFVEPQSNPTLFLSEAPPQKPQKIIISPRNFKKFMNKELPILENVHKDLDQESDTNLSDVSVDTISSAFERNVETLLQCADQRTDKNVKSLKTDSDKLNDPSEIFERCEYRLCDGSIVTLPTKPKTVFHVATCDNLAYLTPEEKRTVIHHQAFIDWKLCLRLNEDGNLPIHLAVIDNDVDFLVRQCVVLRSRHSHVDIFPQGRHLSALHMAIMREAKVECVEKLLAFNADPLEALEEQRTAFHRAAEASNPAYMERLLEHVAKYPGELMKSNESLCNEDIKCVTSEQTEELAYYLYLRISEMSDEEGYTPLMLASRLARHQNVRLLLERCSSTVNLGMKTSGNTALYLAIEGAGMNAIERGDKTKISEDYLKTIECLLSHHADPALENFSGGNVNLLLAEFNMNRLSMFVAERMSALRDIPATKKINQLMFIKDGNTITTRNARAICNLRQAIKNSEMRKSRSKDTKRTVAPNETNDEEQARDISDVLAKMEADDSQVNDEPAVVESKNHAEQSKPIILENRRIIPETSTNKRTNINFNGGKGSMINVSLNSPLTVPKKTYVTKSLNDSSRNILKRKLIEMADLDAEMKMKMLNKST